MGEWTGESSSKKSINSPLPGARIVVRVYGQTIRPFTYSGGNDAQGKFDVDILVPHYTVSNGYVKI